MGKKKSSVGKAKQAKAKQSNSRGKRSVPHSLGGIAMSKGSSSKFQQQQQQSAGANGSLVLVLDGKGKTSIQPSPFSSKFNKPKVKKVFLSSSPPPMSAILNNSKTKSTTKKSNDYDEKADFARQMASLQERHAASKNTGIKQKKSTLLQQGGAVSSLIQSFQPASFQVEKTTNDLLHETVDRMQNMLGVGESAKASADCPTPIRNNQSWATMKIDHGPTDSNPFAALHEQDSDDSDIEKDSPEKNSWSCPVQLAPASFTLMPRTTPTPATTPLRDFLSPSADEDEIDPDL